MFTATFTLFVLTGCGNYGDISSVDEEDYFPRFELKADKIYHEVIELCIGFKSCDKNEEAFKSKGAYEITHYSPDTFVRYDPLGDGVIEKVELLSGSTMRLETSGDNVKRDNELFEKVFGYNGGILFEVSVEKHFAGDDISYFETYIESLKQDGFEQGEGWWWKQNYMLSNPLGWRYVVNEDSSITATWRINTMLGGLFSSSDFLYALDFWPYK
jgi:hypothetical protein